MRAEAASSHCTSSIPTKTGPFAGRVRRAPRNAAAHRAVVGCSALSVLEEEGDGKRTALRRRQFGEDLVEHIPEQVGDSCERELDFGAAGPAREDEETPETSAFEPLPPESGLPDPRPLPRSRARGASREAGLEEVVEGRKLALPRDDASDHACLLGEA